MDSFEKLDHGLSEIFHRKHHKYHAVCEVAVHTKAQLHLVKSAIEQLARENGRNPESVVVKKIPKKKRDKIPAGTVLCDLPSKNKKQGKTL